jgi:hypothetical protein
LFVCVGDDNIRRPTRARVKVSLQCAIVSKALFPREHYLCQAYSKMHERASVPYYTARQARCNVAKLSMVVGPRHDENNDDDDDGDVKGNYSTSASSEYN